MMNVSRAVCGWCGDVDGVEGGGGVDGEGGRGERRRKGRRVTLDAIFIKVSFIVAVVGKQA